MRKYLVLFTQEFSRLISYRVNLIVSYFASFITPVLMLIALLNTKSTTGVTVSSLIPYYVIVSQTFVLVKSEIDQKISDMARAGDINNFLLKPMPFFRYMLFSDLAEKIARLTYCLPILLLTVVFYGQVSPGQYYSPGTILLFILGFPFCYFLSFILAYLVGLSSFWIDEVWAFRNVRWVLIQLFGGVILPYTLFPDKFLQVIKYTPFPYSVSLPARILQGTATPIEFLWAFVWSLILR